VHIFTQTMGVPQLWPFVKAHALEMSLKKIVGKYGDTPVIDFSSIQHTAFRYDSNASHVLLNHCSFSTRQTIIHYLLPFQELAVTLCVDGLTPPCKSVEAKTRAIKRANHLQAVQLCLNAKSAPQRRDLVGAMSRWPDLQEDLILELVNRGCGVMYSPCESDSQAVNLVREGTCAWILAHDGDYLWYDVPMVVPKYEGLRLVSLSMLHPSEFISRVRTQPLASLRGFDRCLFFLGLHAIQLMIVFMKNDYRPYSLVPGVGGPTFTLFLLDLCLLVEQKKLQLSELQKPDVVSHLFFLFAPKHNTIQRSILANHITQQYLEKAIRHVQYCFDHAVVIKNGQPTHLCPVPSGVVLEDLVKIVGDCKQVDIKTPYGAPIPPCTFDRQVIKWLPLANRFTTRAVSTQVPYLTGLCSQGVSNVLLLIGSAYRGCDDNAFPHAEYQSECKVIMSGTQLSFSAFRFRQRPVEASNNVSFLSET